MIINYRFLGASCAALAIGVMVLASGAAAQQDTDYGDAPEDVLAYPSIAGMGFFPTCLGGSNLFVRHGLGWAHFYSMGPQLPWDTEGDGNAGSCPPPPYDLDECYGDGDAGLVSPTSYTIVGGMVVRCPNVVNPISLGAPCGLAQIQANVVNNMPVTGYINALFDWDRDGFWLGGWQCPGAVAPEHAVVDDPIPVGFNGLWTSPPFLVGSPGNVHVWMRLEIAEMPVGPGWDGSGTFEDGESEDYLIHVGAVIPVEQDSWGKIKSIYR